MLQSGRAAVRVVDLVPTDEQMVRQLALLLVEGFREQAPGAWPDEASGREEVQGFLDDGERICRLACTTDGTVLGWIGGLCSYDGNVWELHPLVVHPDYQGQGVGRLLVHDFEEQVRVRGGLTIWLGSDDYGGQTSLSYTDLYVDPWQKMATIQNLRRHPFEFYQKLGYVIVGVLPDANGRGKPDIFMAKRVG